ncbi:MAG: hypothetical protein AB8I08_02090 [Sandaracinaceae bacterium]
MFADVLPVAAKAFSRLFTDRRLWLFGLFVGATGGGINLNASSAQAVVMPAFAMGWFVLAAVLGLVFLGVHAASEGALIEAVYTEHKGRRLALSDAVGVGVRNTPSVLIVKLGTYLMSGLVMGVALGPVLLASVEVLPLSVGLALTIPLALLAVPLIVTLYLVHELALRMVVLEKRGAVNAMRAAAKFLRGRLRYGIGLLLADGLSQVAASVVLAPLAMLVAGAAIGGEALGMTWTGMGAGAVIVAPVVLLTLGARGAFRSRLWTVGFLDQRPELG